MTEPGSTLVGVVMDRSGSMEQVRDVTIAGYNEFLVKQKSLGGKCNFYFTQFDHEYEIVHSYTPIADMPLLTPETYVPRGSTALYDAIGRTITQIGADLAARSEGDRPANVTIVIQTDGYENASQEYRLPRIKDMIKHQTDKYGWNFLFLGAGLSAMDEGRRMGMHVNSMMHYAPAAAGQTVGAFAAVSSNIARTRAGGQSTGYVAEDLAAFQTEVDKAVAEESNSGESVTST